VSALSDLRLAVFLFCLSATAVAQSDVARIRQLFEQQKWQEIIASANPSDSPDIAFYYGSAQARLEHWKQAADAFQIGRHVAPRDPRFPTELAGVAFKQKNYAAAQDWLLRAQRLAPDDAYINDFLATVFFLQGNLDASLKYWNRIGKPALEEVSSDPRPRLDPALFDRAMVFSPAAILRGADLLTSEARLDQLDIFPVSRFELQAREDGKFNLTFRNLERNGCGGKWGCLLTTLGQTPAQTVRFDYYNLGRRALNFSSFYRWDGEKRRISAFFESPFMQQPKWHFRGGIDLRNENWAFLPSFSGPAPLLAALNLKRESASFEFSDVMSGRWQWSAHTEFSHRSFHDVLRGETLKPELLENGPQLKQTLGVHADLLRIPERRLTVDSSASVSLARFWSNPSRTFSQFQGVIDTLWFPQHSGDKYEIRHSLRAGTSFGSPPFDELFTLGVLGDTSLLMRAHVATRDGKKGSAPLGGNYFVSNFDATRNFTPLPLLKIKVGPFVDTGWSNDLLRPPQWLWDTGVQVRFQALGFELALSYGRDLRSGNSAFVARSP
jgi:tetratricopeptide (TPR) repeat protein